jgi:prepilin-type N-terminal cleavage/methylation domain-containing protein
MFCVQNPTHQAPPSKEEGFTLIEVMVALVIFAFGILAVLGMQVTSIRGGYQSQNLTEAASAGANKIEELVSISYDHSDLNIGTHTPTQVVGEPKVEWTVSTPTATELADTKAILLTVKWDEGGREHTVVYEFLKAKDI